MKYIIIVLAVTTLVPLAGCRHNARLRSFVSASNAEMRALEDRYYELQYEYEATAEELQRCQQQLASRNGSAGRGGPEFQVPPEILPDGETDPKQVPDLSPPAVQFDQSEAAMESIGPEPARQKIGQKLEPSQPDMLQQQITIAERPTSVPHSQTGQWTPRSSAPRVPDAQIARPPVWSPNR